MRDILYPIDTSPRHRLRKMRNVDTTTYLADAKNVYGAIQDQVNTETAFMNLLGDGSRFGKPISEIGIRGYTFLARLTPNFNLGYRPEGLTGVGNGTGNAGNANAGNQGLANSTVLLKYAYVPIIITGQANELTKGDKRAFMQAKALEAKFDMKDIVAHVNVVMVAAERGGQLAQVLTATSQTQFTVSSASNLPLAKYLRVGMPVDSGPVGGGLTVGGMLITAINYTTGVVTVTNTGATVLVGDAIYLAGECPPTTGAFPYTAEGLMSLVTSTGAIQGLNPATAGQAAWQAYVEDMAAGTISSQSIMRLKQFVKNRSGANVDCLIFSSAQVNQLVGIATTLLQFQVADQSAIGKKALDLGFTTYSYGGTTIVEEKDGRDDRIFGLACDMYKKFEALPLSMADDEAGDWTRISGSTGLADAVQGLLRWYHQLGTLQRNAGGIQKNYAVPAAFNNQPPSF